MKVGVVNSIDARPAKVVFGPEPGSVNTQCQEMSQSEDDPAGVLGQPGIYNNSPLSGFLQLVTQ